MTEMTRGHGLDHAVLDALECGVAVFDCGGRVAVWNAWLARRSGLSAPQACGRTLADLFGAEVSPALVEAVRMAAADGMASVLSNQLHRSFLPLRLAPDGPVLEQSASVRPLRSGGGCVMQVNDVTPIVRRERHLRQTQAQIRLRNRAIEASSQGIIIVDAQCEDLPIIYTNPAFTTITGYEADEVIGRNCRFLRGEDVDQPGLAEIRAAIAEQREGTAVLRNFRKDGTPFWNELLVAPVVDSQQQVTHFVGIQRDISRRRIAEEARDAALSEARAANEQLSREQAFTNAVLKTVGALVAVVDRRGRIVSFNRACEMVTGICEHDALGLRLGEFIPDPAAAARFRLDEQGRSHDGGNLTTALATATGAERLVRWAFTALKDREGIPTHLICTGVDVTERDRAAALLRAEREILEMIARADPLPAVGDRICRAIEEQLPRHRASLLRLEAEGRTLHHLAAPTLPKDYCRAIDGIVAGAGVGSCGAAAFHGQPRLAADVMADPAWTDFRALAADAGFRACWSVPVLSQADEVLGTFAVYAAEPGLPEDAALEVVNRAARLASIAFERQQAAERIRHMALYDLLTGLANRSLLADRLQSAVAHARRHGRKVALLFIDLDGFKPINDTLGHDAGDAVLATLGKRLKAVLRAEDTAARIGGDEFVVLAEEVSDRADVEVIAEKVLVAVREPITWNGKPVAVGASIGLALYPEDTDRPDGLLTLADNAMYSAKASGKNRWAWRAG